MYDLIIVGAGTAGLSAAIYGVRAGKCVLLLEEKVYGGQIISASAVENYPGIRHISGYEFAEELHRQATELGAELKYEKVREIRKHSGFMTVKTGRGAYDCRAVILATGAKNRQLQVEREKELTGAGVSYCATCDGAFCKGKNAAVVGGGNTALEDAVFLSGYCQKVYLIHRRKEFRGEERLIQTLRGKENVELMLESQVVRLNGERHLESVVVRNDRTGKERELSVTALFIAIGQVPDNRAFADLVSLDAYGYIEAGEDCRTSSEGIFAAGDCTESLDITTGQQKILALLPNAFLQGEAAGQNMAGKETYYLNAMPMNAIGFFGLHIITAGSYDGEAYTYTDGSENYKKLVTKDNELKGFILMGDVKRAGIYTYMIKWHMPIDECDFELLKTKPQLMAFSRSYRNEKLAGGYGNGD
jgi:thioredoxin reductase (NADPH)